MPPIYCSASYQHWTWRQELTAVRTDLGTVPLLSTPSSHSNQSARIHHQASIIDRAFSQIIVGSSQPSSSAAAKRDTPSFAPRRLRCSWHNDLASLLEAAQNIASKGQSLIVRSSEYSVRFPASIRERSSLISRSKDAAAVAQEHGLALLLIAAAAGRARVPAAQASQVHAACCIRPNCCIMLAAQPSLVHHTKRHRARRVYGLMRVYTTRSSQASLPHSGLGSCNFACIHRPRRPAYTQTGC